MAAFGIVIGTIIGIVFDVTFARYLTPRFNVAGYQVGRHHKDRHSQMSRLLILHALVARLWHRVYRYCACWYDDSGTTTPDRAFTGAAILIPRLLIPGPAIPRL